MSLVAGIVSAGFVAALMQLPLGVLLDFSVDETSVFMACWAGAFALFWANLGRVVLWILCGVVVAGIAKAQLG